MLRARGTAINISAKMQVSAGFQPGNLHFVLFTAPLLCRNIATAIAQIIPYPASSTYPESAQRRKGRYRGKYYLRVIMRLRFVRRSITVGSSDCKLSSCRHPGKKQDYRLRRRHRFIGEAAATTVLQCRENAEKKRR